MGEERGSKQPPRRVAAPYLWREVDIGASVEQQLSHIQVFIVRGDVQRRESSLGGGRESRNHHIDIDSDFETVQKIY